MRTSFKIMAVSALSLAAAFGAAPLAAQAQTTPTTTATGARPGNDIGTRESLPLSPYASNITAGDSKSTIAPTAPEPNVGPNANVAQLLMAAKQSLAAGQTGTTDESPGAGGNSTPHPFGPGNPSLRHQPGPGCFADQSGKDSAWYRQQSRDTANYQPDPGQ